MAKIVDLECGCSVTVYNDGHPADVEYCHLHRYAADLRKTAQWAHYWLTQLLEGRDRNLIWLKTVVNDLRDVLTKTGGVL